MAEYVTACFVCLRQSSRREQKQTQKRERGGRAEFSQEPVPEREPLNILRAESGTIAVPD